MSEFNSGHFVKMLLDAPEKSPSPEPPAYSEYLQKHVFDKLAAKSGLDISALDWDAIRLCDLVPEGYAQRYEKTNQKWLKFINRLFHVADSAALTEQRFF